MSKAVAILVAVVVGLALVGLGMLKVGEKGLGLLLLVFAVVTAVNGCMTLAQESKKAREQEDAGGAR